MGKRLDRTVNNPRFWLASPIIPIIVFMALVELLLELGYRFFGMLQTGCTKSQIWLNKTFGKPLNRLVKWMCEKTL